MLQTISQLQYHVLSSKLTVGEAYTYIDICKLLNLKPMGTSVRSKQYQVAEWQRYFTWKQPTGRNKSVVSAIHVTPVALPPTTRTVSLGKYAEPLQYLLASMQQEANIKSGSGKSMVELAYTPTDLYIQMQLAPSKLFNKKYITEGWKEDMPDIADRWDGEEIFLDVSGKIIDSAKDVVRLVLPQLEKASVLRWKRSYFVTSEAGKHIATDEECLRADDSKRVGLAAVKRGNLRAVVSEGLWKDYAKAAFTYSMEEYGIHSFTDIYVLQFLPCCLTSFLERAHLTDKIAELTKVMQAAKQEQLANRHLRESRNFGLIPEETARFSAKLRADLRMKDLKDSNVILEESCTSGGISEEFPRLHMTVWNGVFGKMGGGEWVW